MRNSKQRDELSFCVKERHNEAKETLFLWGPSTYFIATYIFNHLH